MGLGIRALGFGMRVWGCLGFRVTGEKVPGLGLWVHYPASFITRYKRDSNSMYNSLTCLS